MKKLIIFSTLLINYTCYAQNRAIIGIAGKTTAPKMAKVNFTETSNPTALTGWTNFNFSAQLTAISLNTTGWTIVSSGASGDSFSTQGPSTYSNADFPDDILNSKWQCNPGGLFTFTITGLNTGKTYGVKAAIASATGQGGDGKVTVTVGGSTQIASVSSGPTCIELTYTGVVSDGSGHLSITMGGANVFPIINGLIITEN